MTTEGIEVIGGMGGSLAARAQARDAERIANTVERKLETPSAEILVRHAGTGFIHLWVTGTFGGRTTATAPLLPAEARLLALELTEAANELTEAANAEGKGCS